MIGTEYGSTKNEKIYDKIIWEGEVIDVLDGQENGIIRVRIPELDKTTPNDKLPKCFPLFNFSFFRSLPKTGERVTLMFRNVYNTTDSDSKDIRYWISVVHSNVYNIDYQSFFAESNAHYPDSLIKSPQKTSTIVDANGIYPNKEDISINGRNNSTIFLRNNEILFRVGGAELSNPLKFNKKNPTYFLLKTPTEVQKQNAIKTIKAPVFIEPNTQIVVQFSSDTKGTIQTKDKIKNKTISTSVFTDVSKNALLIQIKSEILRLQNLFSYWELVTFDEALNSLPKIYSTDSTEQNITENVLVQKFVNFSTSLVVSDKIFLISHLNNEFNLKKQPDLVTDDDLINLVDKSHPIPLGDKLVEFLDVFRQVMANHVHPYDGMKPVQEELVSKLLNFDLQKLLNPNVFTG